MSECKEVRGHEDYLVFSDGRIFSIRAKRFLKCGSTAAGYKLAKFWKNNKETQAYVHRVVLEAFVGPCPKGMECLHRNGNRLDNRLENLRWGTRKENVADAMRHGTATVGANNGGAKLRESDIGWIVDMSAMGFTGKEIAPYFKVSPTTINRVLSGQTYKQEMENV